MKNRLKELIFNNIGYKILAIAIAIILWLVVLNISDYSITVHVDGIPVERLNANVMDELDQVYDVVSGDTVDIIVKGKRSVVEGLNKDDFYAYADLSKMSITNSVQIFVVSRYEEGADNINITCVDNVMQLSLEDKVSKKFPISVKTKGEPAEGYAVGATSASPNMVKIEGPRSVVNRITDVAVKVGVGSVNSDIEQKADIIILDAYGDKIDNDKLVVKQSQADVTVNIYPTKTVPIYLNTKGKPEDGYSVVSTEYEPRSIKIAGPLEELNKIKSVNIDNVSVSGLDENLQTSVDLKEYLPDELIIADSNTTFAVNISIEKTVTKTINIEKKDVKLLNKINGYEYDVIVPNFSSVEIEGVNESIADIKVSDIEPSIDCEKLLPGRNKIELEFKAIDGIKYNEKVYANVIVTQK